jgi:hypothetical protein
LDAVTAWPSTFHVIEDVGAETTNATSKTLWWTPGRKLVVWPLFAGGGEKKLSEPELTNTVPEFALM